MSKKYLTISVSIVLVCILTCAYFYLGTLKNYKNNDTIKAIPADASIIIQTQNPKKVIDILLNDIKYREALAAFNWFNDFTKNIDTIVNSNNFDTRILNKLKVKPLTISLHREGIDKVKPLFIYPLSNKAEQRNIIDYLTTQNDSLWHTTEEKYNSISIYSLQSISSAKSIYISFNKGYLIASPSSILVENSIRQLRTGFSLLSDETFNNLYKTIGHNCEANIFVNFEHITETLNLLFNSDYKPRLSVFSKLARWGEFDINLKKNQLLINGFLYPSTAKNNLNLLFKGLDGSSTSINKIIPSNVQYIQSFSYKDADQLIDNLHTYLKQRNEIDSYTSKINKLGLNINREKAENIISDIIDDEFALVYANTNPLEKKDGNYLIIKTTGKTKTINHLKTLTNKSEISPIDYYKLDDETKYPIYQSENMGLFKIIFDYFCPDTPSKYYTFLGNYIAFSDTKKSLSNIIYANILKKTLRNDKYHQRFLENFSYKENMFIYCDLAQISHILPNASDFNLLNPNKTQQFALGKFYGLGIQITNANELLYTNICLEYLPNREKEPQTIWQSKLDSTIITKPTLVENHYTKEKEIFVQDKSNMIYLLANNGRILWIKKLDAPILSKVHQIDFYRNNKLQYLFNTKHRIYLLDRNGNHVEKYPINLAHKATNGISLFDYDKNRNYRIFLACENHKTYVYDKNGKMISGWKAKTTEGTVSKPIQHFRIGDKDYIVFSDDIRNYILNRKGQNRVTISPDFTSNKNSEWFATYESNTPILMTTDISGNIKKVNLLNGECSTQELLDNIVPHQYISQSITSHKGKENILITKDEIVVESSNGKKVFNTEIEGNILPVADIYYFSKNDQKLGVFDSNNNKIYLINNDGSIYKNFPLKGQSRFSIGFLNSSSHKFNLIVGGEDNYLYNYRIE
ncbi:hypothetical protein E9993_05605 [Labilibacter sediminis]|nr:hypothetical protein E9993_05605 [Labilibacter sediminis]